MSDVGERLIDEVHVVIEGEGVEVLVLGED
jgi:hypothetical protein